MLREAFVKTAEHTPKEVDNLQKLRRSVFDFQIQSVITAHADWLHHHDRPVRGAVESESLDQAHGVADILDALSRKLDEAIMASDKTGFDHYVNLYNTGLHKYQPAAPDFHFLPRAQFDKAAVELLSAIQGSVPLSISFSWEDISRIYEQEGKPLPPLPKEVIFINDPADPGFINDEITVPLPTKIPFVFVDYTFHLYELPDGVQPNSSPQSIAIRAISL